MAIISVRIRKPFGMHPEALIKRAWKAALTAAAQKAIEIISDRTGRGVDADGRPFRPYSADYAEKKGGSGRKASPPDLTVTGEMLRRLRFLGYDAAKRTATIGFEGQHRNASFSRIKKNWTHEFDTSATVYRDNYGRMRSKATNAFAKDNKWVRRTKRDGTAIGKHGWRLKRYDSTTPMAKVVLGVNKIRPFFYIRHQREMRELARVAQEAFNRVLAEAQRAR